MERLLQAKTHVMLWLEDAGLVTKIAVGLVAAVFFGFWLVFAVQYHIHDDPELKPDAKFTVENGSKAIAMASTLMDQEINGTVWAPNKPWIYPISWSKDMRNYQMGVQYAVARWAVEMADLIGRDRGSGEADQDLSTAAGKFKFDPHAFILPSAVTEYNQGIDHLMAYNRRLAAGQAKMPHLAVNLSTFLDRISKDLGSQSAVIELMVLTPSDLDEADKAHLTDEQKAMLSGNGGYFDMHANAAFFATKGRLYAYYILLKAMGEDFADIIERKGATEQWHNMLLSLRSGATLYSFAISNGASMSWFIPSHLSNQGFFLLRADKQLKECADILNK